MPPFSTSLTTLSDATTSEADAAQFKPEEQLPANSVEEYKDFEDKTHSLHSSQRKHEKRLLLVTEYVEGGSVLDLILDRERDFPWNVR